MCIDYIYEKPWKFNYQDLCIKDKMYIGYKVVADSYTKIDGVSTIPRYNNILYDTWNIISNKDKMLSASNGSIYKCGFHIFLIKEDARISAKRVLNVRSSLEPQKPVHSNVRVVKCRFRDVICFGSQEITMSLTPHYAPVVVAYEIYIGKKQDDQTTCFNTKD